MSTKVEVYGEILEVTVDMELMVRVFNDDENVFEGTIKKFLEINQYDGATIDFVNGLEGKESREEVMFPSGHWKIDRM
jgi:hypothetical protein